MVSKYGVAISGNGGVVVEVREGGEREVRERVAKARRERGRE